MSDGLLDKVPTGYSYLSTIALFAFGGLITAAFSASLSVMAKHAGLAEVLAVGMLVPSFTWLVHLTASWLLLSGITRRLYWGDLARVCVLGSAALLPTAAVNFMRADNPPSLWYSAVNVLCSVAIMAADLFRRTGRHGLSRIWPVSWCATITLNMTIFVLVSRHWW